MVLLDTNNLEIQEHARLNNTKNNTHVSYSEKGKDQNNKLYIIQISFRHVINESKSPGQKTQKSKYIATNLKGWQYSHKVHGSLLHFNPYPNRRLFLNLYIYIVPFCNESLSKVHSNDPRSTVIDPVNTARLLLVFDWNFSYIILIRIKCLLIQ